MRKQYFRKLFQSSANRSTTKPENSVAKTFSAADRKTIYWRFMCLPVSFNSQCMSVFSYFQRTSKYLWVHSVIHRMGRQYKFATGLLTHVTNFKLFVCMVRLYECNYQISRLVRVLTAHIISQRVLGISWWSPNSLLPWHVTLAPVVSVSDFCAIRFRALSLS